MAKERIHDMPQTKGTYQVRGIVSGVEKQNFYSEIKTRNGSDFRSVNFDVECADGKFVTMRLTGMPKEKVYLSKRDQVTGKTTTKSVDWSHRNNEDKDGYRLIGINLGLEKITDDKGKTSNVRTTLVEYDACEYIKDKIKDGMSVFVKGNLDYSSYVNKKGEVARSTKYVPSQISLCKDDIDFDSDAFVESHAFTQTIVFTGISKDADTKTNEGNRYIVSAKIVNYNSIEDASFEMTDDKLAMMFKKKLKPYTAIEVHGKIVIENVVETVDDDDLWGEANEMSRVNAPTRRYFLITGATPSTIDTETYSEDKINEAIRRQNAAKKAEENFNGKANSSDSDEDDWGESASSSDDDMPWDA